MAEKAVYLTEQGKEQLEAELHFLRTTRRKEVAERIHQAKEYGDVMENGEYEDAKNEQAFIEGRIRTIENILSKAIPIESEHHDNGVVDMGSTVTVIDDEHNVETWTIVGSAEANSRQGKISNECLVGAALLGAKVGDTITVEAPMGKQSFKVISIQ